MSEIKEYVRTFNIFNTLSDGIYISDARGKTLWLNDASERIIGRKREELIGRNVRELENEKVFYPSVTRLTLEKQRTVSTVQTSKNGQKHL
ncbi:MAG: PAS domain-containing protein, partial [Novibacillus thermophilus]